MSNQATYPICLPAEAPQGFVCRRSLPLDSLRSLGTFDSICLVEFIFLIKMNEIMSDVSAWLKRSRMAVGATPIPETSFRYGAGIPAHQRWARLAQIFKI